MSTDLNKVMLIGRLGKDPELRYTPNGDAVVSFNLATNKTWKNKEQEKSSKTNWNKIVGWRKLAEICGEYLKKGSRVFVEGRLEERSWEDNDGKKRHTTEVIMENMQMLDSKDPSSQPKEVSKEEMAGEEEIPF